MKKLATRIVGTLSILALFLCISTTPMPVSAHEEAEITATPVTSSSVTSYVFSAHAGDFLSRIVRRALQLRAVTDQPTAMYCENIISSQLGGTYIEIDQQVTVSYEQIDACVTEAKTLTAEQRAAWQAYADTVSFDVNDVKPINNSITVVPAQPKENPLSSTPQTDEKITPESDGEQTKTDQKPAKATKPEVPFNNYLWYIPVAVLGVMLFILSDLLPGSRTRR